MAVQLKPVPHPASAQRGAAWGGRAGAARLPRRERSSSAARERQSVSSRAVPEAAASQSARSAGGVSMLLVFTAAVLAVTLAVVILAIANQWWVLVPVMIVDLAVTFGVTAMTLHLLADGAEPLGPARRPGTRAAP
jgi:hypothetical protein